MSDAQVAKRTVKIGGQIARNGGPAAPVASPVTPIRSGDKRVEHQERNVQTRHL